MVSLTSLIRVLILGIGLGAPLLIRSPSLAAADRFVLVQAVWDNQPPHYLAIKGGRNQDRHNVVFKPGRHSPADEWILREISPGVVAIETSDPFFPPLSIYYEWQGAKLPNWPDAHEIRLKTPQNSIEHRLKKDLWIARQIHGDVYSLRVTHPGIENYFLMRTMNGDEIFPRPLVRKMSPQSEPESHFRIIDLKSKP